MKRNALADSPELSLLTAVGSGEGVTGIGILVCVTTLVNNGDAANRVVTRHSGVVMMVMGSIRRQRQTTFTLIFPSECIYVALCVLAPAAIGLNDCL